MRTTIRIDDELYRELKQRASGSGRTVGSLIEDAVRAALDERMEASPPSPLPTFRGSGMRVGVDLNDNAGLLDIMDSGRQMRAVDVNVLVYAHREEAENHLRYKEWLDGARRDDEPLALSTLVLSGFIRVVTHPRVFREPSPLPIALAFTEALRAGPSVIRLEPGARHWDIFSHLCDKADARGNLVPDAYLAALAIESGATFYTADRGVARFPGLRVRHPLDDPEPG